jgi:hypothetical protein
VRAILTAPDCDDFIGEVADYILRRARPADDAFTAPDVFEVVVS